MGLVFNTNMALGCMLISMWEGEHVGIRWSNILEPASPNDSMTFAYIMAQFLASTLLYFLITFYVSNVFPGEFGLPKKWYFFCDPKYWCGSGSYMYKGAKRRNSSITSGHRADSESSTSSQFKVFIDNLCKSYNGGKTFSVQSMSLSMEENEITVLLGHNGAGQFVK